MKEKQERYRNFPISAAGTNLISDIKKNYPEIPENQLSHFATKFVTKLEHKNSKQKEKKELQAKQEQEKLAKDNVETAKATVSLTTTHTEKTETPEQKS